PLKTQLENLTKLTVQVDALRKSLATTEAQLVVANARNLELERRLAEFESHKDFDALVKTVRAVAADSSAPPAPEQRTMAQVAAAAALLPEPRRPTPRSHNTHAAARVERMVTGTATIGDFFKPNPVPRPIEGSTNTSIRPIRPTGERLAPLYIRTRFRAEIKGAPIKFCKAALRLLPGMPSNLPEVCPIGRENTLWEIFLPRDQHPAFRTAVEHSGGGVRMAEEGFNPLDPPKIDISDDREEKARRNYIMRRGRQLAGAISSRNCTTKRTELRTRPDEL
ncbi:hypothetical protein HK405_002768, partial [Cladochytrium tenue]